MQEIIQLDKDVFLYLNNLGNSSWDEFWEFVSYRFSWIPFYAFLLLLIWKNYGWKKTLAILLLTGLMIVAADQLTNILKYNIKRLRPCFTAGLEGLMRPIGCDRSGQYGFTSAHSANHFALAIFLGLIFKSKIKWFIYFLLVWAGVVAYSRIYLGVHFPLDILCGGIIGGVFGWLTYKFYNWILNKYAPIFREN